MIIKDNVKSDIDIFLARNDIEEALSYIVCLLRDTEHKYLSDNDKNYLLNLLIQIGVNNSKANKYTISNWIEYLDNLVIKYL